MHINDIAPRSQALTQQPGKAVIALQSSPKVLPISGIEVKPRVVKTGDSWTLSEKVERDSFGNTVMRPGEVGEAVASELEKLTGFETRAIALGHLQRGGSPCAYDRILGTRFGIKAAEALHQQAATATWLCCKA